MLVLLGYILVVGSVLGGYMMVGGHRRALYQPSELVIIGGAALALLLSEIAAKRLRRR